MDNLTKEQEDQIHDLPHHDKKVEKSFTITNNKWIDPELFHLIKKSIGGEKLDVNETFGEIPGKIDRWHKGRSKTNTGR